MLHNWRSVEGLWYPERTCELQKLLAHIKIFMPFFQRPKVFQTLLELFPSLRNYLHKMQLLLTKSILVFCQMKSTGSGYYLDLQQCFKHLLSLVFILGIKHTSILYADSRVVHQQVLPSLLLCLCGKNSMAFSPYPNLIPILHFYFLCLQSLTRMKRSQVPAACKRSFIRDQCPKEQ